MDRDRLAQFLRTRREQLQPTDVGLPAGDRRRTPGLRREEVAVLAAMSVDYYTRLEQRRGPQPSRQVLAGLARALRLSGDERAHLFHLAGEEPERRTVPSHQVRPGILHMVERLDAAAVMVIDAKYEVLAWNHLAAALLADFSALPRPERNLARRRFLDDADGPDRFGHAQTERYARDLASGLRAASGRYPDDRELSELIDELLAGSADFARLWSEHQVGVQRTMCTLIRHPVVGEVEVSCEILDIPDDDQRLLLYTADPGSPSYDSLQLLKVLGTRDLGSPALPPMPRTPG